MSIFMFLYAAVTPIVTMLLGGWLMKRKLRSGKKFPDALNMVAAEAELRWRLQHSPVISETREGHFRVDDGIYYTIVATLEEARAITELPSHHPYGYSSLEYYDLTHGRNSKKLFKSMKAVKDKDNDTKAPER